MSYFLIQDISTYVLSLAKVNVPSSSSEEAVSNESLLPTLSIVDAWAAFTTWKTLNGAETDEQLADWTIFPLRIQCALPETSLVYDQEGHIQCFNGLAFKKSIKVI